MDATGCFCWCSLLSLTFCTHLHSSISDRSLLLRGSTAVIVYLLYFSPERAPLDFSYFTLRVLLATFNLFVFSSSSLLLRPLPKWLKLNRSLNWSSSLSCHLWLSSSTGMSVAAMSSWISFFACLGGFQVNGLVFNTNLMLSRRDPRSVVLLLPRLVFYSRLIWTSVPYLSTFFTYSSC